MTMQTIRQSRAFWAGVAFVAGMLGTAFSSGFRAREFMGQYVTAQQLAPMADTLRVHARRMDTLDLRQTNTERKLDTVYCVVVAQARGQNAALECLQ